MFFVIEVFRKLKLMKRLLILKNWDIVLVLIFEKKRNFSEVFGVGEVFIKVKFVVIDFESDLLFFFELKEILNYSK